MGCRKPATILYTALKGDVKLLVISDSAFRKEDSTGLAMRGAIIAIAETHPTHPGGRVQLLEYYNRRQRRVTRSTCAAELHGVADATEVSKLMAFALTELLYSHAKRC